MSPTLAALPLTLAFGFVHPLLFAAGAACIAIPILIHLLMRRRRKPTPWAAMKFLLEAYRKQRRRLKLEQFLLLAARCLVVLLIALALGRPVLGAAGLLGRGSTTLYVLVDNSLASSVEDAGGVSALDRHRRAAEALISELSVESGDRVALVTLGAPAEPITLPPSTDLGAVTQWLGRLTPTDGAADLQGAMEAVRGTIATETDSGGRTVVAVLSDFLAGSARTSAPLGGEAANTDSSLAALDAELIASTPAERGAGNVTVVDLRPLRSVVVAPPDVRAADRQTQLGQARVLLRRSGEGVGQAQRVTVRLIARIGDERAPLGRATATFAPGQTETSVSISPEPTSASITRGAAVLEAQIDRDPLPGDNTRRRVVALRESIRVGVVAPPRLGGGPGVASFTPADWLRLALEPTGDPSRAPLEISSIDPSAVDPSRLAGLDAVLVATPDRLQPAAWSRLASFTRGGGLLMVSPSAEASVQLWTEAFTRELGLRWTIAREPDELNAIPLAAEASGDPSSDPLALVRAELGELAPAVRIERALPIELAPESGMVVLAAGDRPIVVAGPPGGDAGRGLVIALATAPDLAWTNLPAKPLMVPLMQELVRQGVGRARGGSTSLAGATPSAPTVAVELRRADGETIGLVDGVARRAVRTAGVWQAIDRQGRVRESIAINPDADAGNTNPRQADEVADWLATAGLGEPRWIESGVGDGNDPDATADALAAGSGDSHWSWPLLIAAAALAVFEMALARFASHASVSDIGPASTGAGS
ncbi:MAG: BatA domain-containing protein [Planctomycetota bacterium]